jgi:hypothetical protein
VDRLARRRHQIRRPQLEPSAIPYCLPTQKQGRIFTAFDGIEYEQELEYATQDWHDTYKHDRNSIESTNYELEYGSENLKDSSRRPLRGLAAQQYIVTMIFVASNLRKIARFLKAAQAPAKKPPIERKRNRKGLSNYARWRYKVHSVEASELDPPLRT